MRTIPNTIIAIEEQSSNPAVAILERNKRGSCSICSDEYAGVAALTLCRYWDCDDGWMLGKLCAACIGFCRAPREDDYAYGIDGDAFLVEADAGVIEDTF